MPTEAGTKPPAAPPSRLAYEAMNQGAAAARIPSDNTAERQRWPDTDAGNHVHVRGPENQDDPDALFTGAEAGEEDQGGAMPGGASTGQAGQGICGAAAQAYGIGSRSGRAQALLGVTAAAAAAAAAEDEDLNLRDEETRTAVLAAQEVLNNPAAVRILLHLMQQRQQQVQGGHPAPVPRRRRRQGLDQDDNEGGEGEEERESAGLRASAAHGPRAGDATAAAPCRAPANPRTKEVWAARQPMARQPSASAFAAPARNADVAGVRAGHGFVLHQPGHAAPAAYLTRTSPASVLARHTSLPAYLEACLAAAGAAAAEADAGREEDVRREELGRDGACWDDVSPQLGHRHGTAAMLALAGPLPRRQPPVSRRHGQAQGPCGQAAVEAPRRAGSAQLPLRGRRPASPPQPPARHPPSPQFTLAAQQYAAAAAAGAGTAIETASRRGSQEEVLLGKRRVTDSNSSSGFGAELGGSGEEDLQLQQHLPKRVCPPLDLGRLAAGLQASRRRTSGTSASATAADEDTERASAYAGYLVY